MALNAERADKDHLGNTIYETYGKTLDYDLTKHEIYLKTGQGNTIGTVKLGALADANAVSTTYQPAGTNTTASLTIYPTTSNVLQSVSNAGAFPTLTGTVDANGVIHVVYKYMPLYSLLNSILPKPTQNWHSTHNVGN